MTTQARHWLPEEEPRKPGRQEQASRAESKQAVSPESVNNTNLSPVPIDIVALSYSPLHTPRLQTTPFLQISLKRSQLVGCLTAPSDKYPDRLWSKRSAVSPWKLVSMALLSCSFIDSPASMGFFTACSSSLILCDFIFQRHLSIDAGLHTQWNNWFHALLIMLLTAASEMLKTWQA